MAAQSWSSSPHGGDWDEWPEDLRVREMPQLKSEARLRRVASWTPHGKL